MSIESLFTFLSFFFFLQSWILKAKTGGTEWPLVRFPTRRRGPANRPCAHHFCKATSRMRERGMRDFSPTPLSSSFPLPPSSDRHSGVNSLQWVLIDSNTWDAQTRGLRTPLNSLVSLPFVISFLSFFFFYPPTSCPLLSLLSYTSLPPPLPLFFPLFFAHFPASFTPSPLLNDRFGTTHRK